MLTQKIIICLSPLKKKNSTASINARRISKVNAGGEARQAKWRGNTVRKLRKKEAKLDHKILIFLHSADNYKN